MSRRLALVYFFLVAAVMLAIHHTVYFVTFERIEQSIAQMHLEEAKEQAFAFKDIGQDKTILINPKVTAYLSRNAIPKQFVLPNEPDRDVAFEIYIDADSNTEYFMMLTDLSVDGIKRDLWLMDLREFNNLDDDALQHNLVPLLIVSLVILLLSLIVIQRISDSMTQPISQLAEELSDRPSSDLSKIDEPNGVMTHETQTLLNSINAYRQQITQMLDRERSFNDYASHELRSPLMVIKGATSLLQTRQDDSFIQKQALRLQKASDEMSDFISTLLALTKEDRSQQTGSITLSKNDIEEIIQSYAYFLEGKPVSWSLQSSDSVRIMSSLTLFKILLGNLVKNAFQYTEEGSVNVQITDKTIRVIDTGVGLKRSASDIRGHGLGLVIVGDICRKFGYELELEENEPLGCIATLFWSKRDGSN